jgi:hypothetical protein
MRFDSQGKQMINEIITIGVMTAPLAYLTHNNYKLRQSLNRAAKDLMHCNARSTALDTYANSLNIEYARLKVQHDNAQAKLEYIAEEIPFAITEAIMIGPIDELDKRLNAVYRQFLNAQPTEILKRKESTQ